MSLTIQQVLDLSPDDKSTAAARGLLSPKLWQLRGFNSDALWAVYGVGGNFQVRIDLSNTGCHCTCPSRKYPCKHALALLMLFVTLPDLFPLSAAPEWVEDWIEKRRQKQRKAEQQQSAKVDLPEKPIDREAQAKRVEAREEKVAAGLEQLSIWLDDLVRHGIATLETKAFDYWDTQSRRLVDAQARGLANRVRNLSEIPHSSPDWPQRMASELGKLRLLVQAAQHLASLNPNLQQEVRQLLGWTVSQTELEEQGEAVEDDWWLIGQRITDDDRIRTERTWAVGRETGREALILQFAPGTQPFPEKLEPGTMRRQTFLFYPGVSRQRTKPVGEAIPIEFPPEDFPFLDHFEQLLQASAEQIARNPWHVSKSCLIRSVTLTQHLGTWFLRDREAAGLPVLTANPLQLLAETGGRPIDVCGEWNGFTLSLFGYIAQGRFHRCP